MVPGTAVPLPSVRVSPEQKARAGPAWATAAGKMVTVTAPVATQPLAVVAVRVYTGVRLVVPRLGRVTVGFGTEGLLRPVAGLQA